MRHGQILNLFLGDFKLRVSCHSTQQLVFRELNLTIFIILMILFQLPDKLSVVH